MLIFLQGGYIFHLNSNIVTPTYWWSSLKRLLPSLKRFFILKFKTISLYLFIFLIDGLHVQNPQLDMIFFFLISVSPSSPIIPTLISLL